MCAVEDCQTPANAARGMCRKHYARWRRHGDAGTTKTIHGDPMAAFMQKVEKTDTCWLWTGTKTPSGYGHFRDSASGRTMISHRWLYERAVGTIPPLPSGAPMPLDHLCRTPACVRPEHLEPVTPRENTRRGLAMEFKTHCKRGHEFTPENTWYNTKGNRGCKACRPIYRTEKKLREAVGKPAEG